MRWTDVALCMVIMGAGTWASLPIADARAAEECCCVGATPKPLAWTLCTRTWCDTPSVICNDASVTSGYDDATCWRPDTVWPCPRRTEQAPVQDYSCLSSIGCSPPVNGVRCVLTTIGDPYNVDIVNCIPQGLPGAKVCQGNPTQVCEH